MHIRRCEERDRELYLRLAKEFYHSPAVLHPVPDSYFERTFDEMMRSDVYADGFLLEEEDGTCMGYALTGEKLFAGVRRTMRLGGGTVRFACLSGQGHGQQSL